LPPDVRYRLENKGRSRKLDSIHSGFAARCEAGLRPAAKIPKDLGWAPGSALGQISGQSPDQGHSPFLEPNLNGEA